METPLTYAESIVIARSPGDLYDMVSDVTRMGEWSPVCTACWWDDGDGPRVGAWFTGRNELPERDPWETRSLVVAASPGEEFAFTVGGTWARWGYTFTPVPGGTQVTESWNFLPDGIKRFGERFGDDAAAQVANRFEAARTGIPATLAALKRAAESGPDRLFPGAGGVSPCSPQRAGGGAAMPITDDGYMMVLFVKDLDRARDFYRNVMGLEHAKNENSFMLGPDALVLIDQDTADDLLSPADVDHEPTRSARSVIVTVVDDVDAAFAELRSKGVEFIRAPEDRPWGMRCAHFKDPDGNVWEIHKRLGER